MDESSKPPLPLSRGSSKEQLRHARMSRDGGIKAEMRMEDARESGEDERKYADVLELRAIIERLDRVYAVAPSHDGQKLAVALRSGMPPRRQWCRAHS